ncbi:cell division protein ZapB [Desulfolutivibrio sulfoxidireducens]|uniref:cell division protein ZapB n=1 Tax=Desulfolutivibrio sulfoxidireducens TaxID=2773299 RepID=UPI00159E2034|nr:cell division protein ZapB [Desulfolutivibrio sulfoxidireducens]QLA15185.1 cell division protein ZapB [Desulfolutivibrio sulfoxidireducens]QLA18756.1 cell division protein ZapB [Desulfolutivibrio sulfoxidireducens]
MDIFQALEDRVDRLLTKVKTLEAENGSLKAELDKERTNRDAITARVDSLLKRIQEEIA